MDNRAFEEIQLSYFAEVTNTADDIEEAIRLIELNNKELEAEKILSARLAELRQVAFELQKDLEISTKKEPIITLPTKND